MPVHCDVLWRKFISSPIVSLSLQKRGVTHNVGLHLSLHSRLLGLCDSQLSLCGRTLSLHGRMLERACHFTPLARATHGRLHTHDCVMLNGRHANQHLPDVTLSHLSRTSSKHWSQL